MKNIYNYLLYFVSIKQQNGDEETGKEINGKETNHDDIQIQRIQRRMVRSKRNKGITTRATVRQTRGRVIFFSYLYVCVLFVFSAFKFLIIIDSLISLSHFNLFSK